MRTLQKKIQGFLLLFSISVHLFANASPLPHDAPKTLDESQSKAIEFARQAGSIAGVASACGQNLGDFSARVTEAITKLANDAADQTAAALIYQRTRQEAQIAEKKKQIIPCAKVLHDFQNLPIMQSDYKTNVIANLIP